MKRTKIIGAGHYVPENVVTNHDLAKLFTTSDEWIRERSGIEERRFITPGVHNTTNMGTRAAKLALERANLTPDDVDFIIFATLSPDYYFPGPGVMLQRELGMKPTGALDVRNQCSGFIYGLSVADAYIRAGIYKTILLVGSETQSIALDMTDRGRNTAVLFGDGAGAVVLTATENENEGILSTHLYAEGEHADQLCLQKPGTGGNKMIYPELLEDPGIFPIMNGNFVFKNAITRMSEVVVEALTKNNLTTADIDMLVPHQANLRITQMVQRQLGLSDDRAYSNIQKYGNTTAATIPICLSELWEQNRIKPGQLYALAAFGSGFTWASALIRW